MHVCISVDLTTLDSENRKSAHYSEVNNPIDDIN